MTESSPRTIPDEMFVSLIQRATTAADGNDHHGRISTFMMDGLPDLFDKIPEEHRIAAAFFLGFECGRDYEAGEQMNTVLA